MLFGQTNHWGTPNSVPQHPSKHSGIILYPFRYCSMVVSGTGSVSLYTVQGTDTVLSIHILHTVPVHVPKPYTSTGLVTDSGTAGTNTLCKGTRNGIAFVPGQYHFCTGSVSLLYWVSIAFVLGQYCFCAGSVSLFYWVNVVFVYHNSVVYLLLLYQFTLAYVMYAYLTFIIIDWYKSVFGIRCLLF